jgi:sec-independent protein translocase protein TatC
MADVEMTFVEHLTELRTRLIRSLLGLGAFFIAGMIFRNWILEQMMRPLPEDIQLQMLAPHEGFMATLRLAVYAGLFCGIPVIAYQATMFVLPALKTGERKVIITAIFVGFVLAFLGFGFAYFVILDIIFPALRKFLEVQGLVTNYRLTEYIKFVGTLIVAFGAAFQVPMLVVVLAKLGVLPVHVLARNTPIVVLVLAIVSAVLTPSDVYSMLLMLGPLLALYTLGLGVAAALTRGSSDDE